MIMPMWWSRSTPARVVEPPSSGSGTTIVVRTGLLVLCTVLTLLSPSRWDDLPWLGLVVAAAAVSALVGSRPAAVLAAPAVESVVCVVAVLGTGLHDSPILPALLGPAFVGGLTAGMPGAVLTSVLPGLTLLAACVAGYRGTDYVAASATWIVLAAATGTSGTGLRQITAGKRRDVQEPSYAAAYRLLAQLRPVARQLSVGLDTVTIGEGLLQTLHGIEPFDSGLVLVRTGSSRLSRLAAHGEPCTTWNVSVDEDTPFGEAWLSQRPRRVTTRFDGAPGSGLVLPLTIGLRSFGLIGLETASEGAFQRPFDAMETVVAEAALRLGTALLFEEVRSVATAEERRRLAREIHDGIAQELSYLGYVVDDVAATARARQAGDGEVDSDAAADDLDEKFVELRSEISRIVGELRMSIYDLRSEVSTQGGLGAALSDYVRQVARQSGITVHLSLSLAPDRLPAETEAELLRIAQEAVTNARRHADADNLWVSLEVDPPGALLRIEDDGRGLGDPREDSVGIAIMRERAARLRTTVRIGSRSPSGTSVEVELPVTGDRHASHRVPVGPSPVGVEEPSR
jgi:signal transduction histidine kinase